LSRVLKPGGKLILGENNKNSIDSKLHLLKSVIQKKVVEKSPSGIIYWPKTPQGDFMVRETDMGWLIDRFNKYGLINTIRIARQFTESYVLVPFKPAKIMIHKFNMVYFNRLRSPFMAFGNLLVFEKKETWK
jgi:hypothetical protein